MNIAEIVSYFEFFIIYLIFIPISNAAENGQVFVYYGGKKFLTGNSTRGDTCRNSRYRISPCPGSAVSDLIYKYFS